MTLIGLWSATRRVNLLQIVHANAACLTAYEADKWGTFFWVETRAAIWWSD